MNEKQYHSQDQVNFIGLKNFVYAFLQEFFKFVAFTQTVVRRKLIYMIIGAALGVGAGLYYYYNKRQVYTASMSAIFNRLNARTYGQVVQNLNTLAATGENGTLAQALKIPNEVAAYIINIDARNMSDAPLASDTTNKTYQLFKINVVLANEASLDTLQTALINYFNNLPYLKNMREVEQQYLQETLKSIDRDILKLDSLKTGLNNFMATAKVSSTIYNNAVNPAEVYEQSTLIYAEREKTSRLLYIEQNPVSLVDRFKLVKAPRSKTLPDLLLIIGSVGLFTGFLFGLLLETKNQVLPSK